MEAAMEGEEEEEEEEEDKLQYSISWFPPQPQHHPLFISSFFHFPMSFALYFSYLESVIIESKSLRED